jgi:hypothetical protein
MIGADLECWIASVYLALVRILPYIFHLHAEHAYFLVTEILGWHYCFVCLVVKQANSKQLSRHNIYSLSLQPRICKA